MTTLIWIVCIAAITMLCLREEAKEYREKHNGFTRREVRAYRRMMADSSNGSKKKSSDFSELQGPAHYN